MGRMVFYMVVNCPTVGSKRHRCVPGSSSSRCSFAAPGALNSRAAVLPSGYGCRVDELPALMFPAGGDEAVVGFAGGGEAIEAGDDVEGFEPSVITVSLDSPPASF
jgi:hypothetical protein